MKNKNALHWQWWKWVLLTAYTLLWSVVFMAIGGDWFWVQGWIFAIYLFVMSYSVTVYLYIKDPALLKERMKRPGADNTVGWDKYWFYLFIPLFLSWFVIMPLDGVRYEWTAEFALWMKWAGGLSFIPSFYFIFKSFVDNTYLSPNVRIQKERKQKLVDTGVYGIVRHPMYLGFIFWMIGGPLLVSSLWGLLLGFLSAFGLAIRIGGEEKMLVKELRGYKAYRKKVKYRLFPLIW